LKFRLIAPLGLLALLCLNPLHAADKDALHAGYLCQQHALRQVKTLGNARSAAPVATPATDPRWQGMADVWVANGRISMQTHFGGAAKEPAYACTVQKTSNGRWTLLDLQWPQGQP